MMSPVGGLKLIASCAQNSCKATTENFPSLFEEEMRRLCCKTVEQTTSATLQTNMAMMSQKVQ